MDLNKPTKTCNGCAFCNARNVGCEKCPACTPSSSDGNDEAILKLLEFDHSGALMRGDKESASRLLARINDWHERANPTPFA